MKNAKVWCIGGPGDDNLYILKVEHTRTGALIYVPGMCSYLVSMMYSLECSSSCSVDHSFDFFYFLMFSSATKGLDALTFLETLKLEILKFQNPNS